MVFLFADKCRRCELNGWIFQTKLVHPPPLPMLELLVHHVGGRALDSGRNLHPIAVDRPWEVPAGDVGVQAHPPGVCGGVLGEVLPVEDHLVGAKEEGRVHVALYASSVVRVVSSSEWITVPPIGGWPYCGLPG